MRLTNVCIIIIIIPNEGLAVNMGRYTPCVCVPGSIGAVWLTSAAVSPSVNEFISQLYTEIDLLVNCCRFCQQL